MMQNYIHFKMTIFVLIYSTAIWLDLSFRLWYSIEYKTSLLVELPIGKLLKTIYNILYNVIQMILKNKMWVKSRSSIGENKIVGGSKRTFVNDTFVLK